MHTDILPSLTKWKHGECNEPNVNPSVGQGMKPQGSEVSHECNEPSVNPSDGQGMKRWQGGEVSGGEEDRDLETLSELAVSNSLQDGNVIF